LILFTAPALHRWVEVVVKIELKGKIGMNIILLLGLYLFDRINKAELSSIRIVLDDILFISITIILTGTSKKLILSDRDSNIATFLGHFFHE